MRRRFARFVAPVVLVAAALGACGGDGEEQAQVGDALTSDSTTSEPAPTTTAGDGTVVEVTVTGGVAEGGVRRAEVKLGNEVVLRVRSDTDDEVHVHGYDHEFVVGPGVPGELVFTADIPGVFEVELHGSGREILKLQVS